MRNLRSASLTIVVAVVLAAAAVLQEASPYAVLGAQTAAGPTPNADFAEFLVRVDTAQLELQNGRPAAFKALWSQGNDVTLSGGLGGPIEKGWEAISTRLDWVGTRFSNGTNRIERIVSNVSGDLGYVIQAEHLRFRVPGQAAESTLLYRATMIFRRESGQWRIVHRQADSQVVKQ